MPNCLAYISRRVRVILENVRCTHMCVSLTHSLTLSLVCWREHVNNEQCIVAGVVVAAAVVVIVNNISIEYGARWQAA